MSLGLLGSIAHVSSEEWQKARQAGLAGARLARALHAEGGAGVSIQSGIGGCSGRDVVRFVHQALAGWWKLIIEGATLETSGKAAAGAMRERRRRRPGPGDGEHSRGV